MSKGSDTSAGYLIVAPWEVTSHGGVNGVIHSLVRETQRAGDLSPIILQSSWPHRRMAATTALGVRVALLRLRSPLSALGWLASIRNLLGYLVSLPRTLAQVRRLCVSHGVVAINVHYPSMSSLTFVLLRMGSLFRGQLIFSFHGSDIHNAAKLGGFSRWLFLWSLRRVDSLVVVSEQLSRFVIGLCPDLAARVHVVYNGVETELFDSVRTPRPIPASDPVVISVASFDPVKGVDVLLRAIPLVLRQCVSARFLLVGESGTQDEYLQQLADELGVASHVEWHCNVPHSEVPALLTRADVFVLPSREEALGMALLEAAIVGLPVVAARVGGIPEIVRGSEDGILVPSEDPHALAGAILWVVRHPDVAARMGDHLRQTVKARFTWRRAYQQYVQLALGRKPSKEGVRDARRRDQRK
ncbi:MAG TPA: glycosyltransferase family 4 protein [Rhodanobacteraceae bacterium]